MPFQKCEKCGRPATHKFTRMIEGHAVDFFFCPEHAAEFSPLQLQQTLVTPELAQLLAGLLKSEQGQKAADEAADTEELRCTTCGRAFRQYRQTLLLGCSDCYRVFEKPLQDDLRRRHGTVRHTQKPLVPAIAGAPPAVMLEALQTRLEIAIADEDFELAVKLRDEIRRLKGEK
ncbi:MAG: UvrB/UvrC motif-containing protein [Candidatus Sumerlaeia bacterium]|nr:UvrB/UvrC motif-containing protein [Candidatus Sumerlaeia bacterium]